MLRKHIVEGAPATDNLVDFTFEPWARVALVASRLLCEGYEPRLRLDKCVGRREQLPICEGEDPREIPRRFADRAWRRC